MVRVSHVGSFPLDYSKENVCRITRDLGRVGVDAPPYPQLRSFIDIYLTPLVENGILEQTPTGYILKIDVDELADTRPPYTGAVVNEAIDFIDCVKKYRIVFKWIRAPVTGVFTLASRILIGSGTGTGLEDSLLPRIDVVGDFFIKYIGSFIRNLVAIGFNIIFIDEPILGVIVGRKRILYGVDEDTIIDIFDRLLKPVGLEHGVHVCGRISSKLFEVLSRIERIKVMNFEFYDNPQNMNSINYSLLEQYDKVLAPGVASARKPVAESIEDILSRLNKLRSIARDRIDLVSADCGFSGLRNSLGDAEKEYNISIKKLENIVAAVRIFEKQL